jgi:PGF-CTERM protein
MGIAFAVALLVVAAGAAPGGVAADDGPAVDVVFVFDNSISTNEDRYHMAREIGDLHQRMESAGIDARYGLVTYNDTPRVEQPLTGEFAAFDRAMHFQSSGSVERASDAILTATEMDFRTDAETVVVLVTDEDDDSSADSRTAAVDALSGHDFVAVSPATPYESSCAVHSPPCDNETANELRTVAQDVGGDWISQGNDAATIVDEIGTIIESQVDTSSNSGSSGGVSVSRPDLEVVSRTANNTTVALGEPVAFNVTVENDGSADGDYEAVFSHEGEILAEEAMEVPADESRTLTVSHTFMEAGNYTIMENHERVAQIEVTPPPATAVETAETNGSVMTAEILHARSKTPVSVPLNGSWQPPADGISLENLTLTPTQYGDFVVELDRHEQRPNGTATLPEHVRPVTYLVVDTTLADDQIESLALEVNSTRKGATLYHYEPGSEDWVVFPDNPGEVAVDANQTNGTMPPTFAIGIREPAFSVTDVGFDATEVTVGDQVMATVTVRNDGRAEGEYNAALRFGGEAVANSSVSVPANATRQVSVTYRPQSHGTHTASVGNATQEIVVEQAATPTPTPTPTASPTPTPTEEPATPTEPDATDTPTATPGADGPGFTGVVAIMVLVGLALLAVRRR